MRLVRFWICFGALSVAVIVAAFGYSILRKGVPARNDPPACVSAGYDYVCKDLEPRQLHYMIHPKAAPTSRTDDDSLYARFLGHIRQRLAPAGGAPGSDGQSFYVLFNVYFDYDKSFAEQFAVAIICTRPFGTKENECRNRNYYFPSRKTPEKLGDTLLNDIVKTTPVMTACKLRRVSKAPPKKYCQ
jgi:hypothetical protein